MLPRVTCPAGLFVGVEALQLNGRNTALLAGLTPVDEEAPCARGDSMIALVLPLDPNGVPPPPCCRADFNEEVEACFVGVTLGVLKIDEDLFPLSEFSIS